MLWRRMLETYDSVSVSSYAHISTIEQAPITDLIEYWEGPATSFIVPCEGASQSWLAVLAAPAPITGPHT